MNPLWRICALSGSLPDHAPSGSWQPRGFAINQLTEWLCAAPARQVALHQRKGSIAVGGDADIVIWNPDAEFRIAPEMIHHRHKLTPYAGEVLLGKVEKTFLRGQMVYDGAEFSDARGQTLLRRNI